MRSKVCSILLLATMLLVCPTDVQAQFWKKWFDKEEKKPVRRPPVPPKKATETTTRTKAKKKESIEYPETQLRERYRIDVLVPLYLDELVKNNKPTFKDKVPEKASAGLSFYEGIKLAADSLSALGYNIDVYVHDITQQDLSPEAMVKSDMLEETDLIIGALQSNQLQAIASFAKKSNVNFISALSPSDADIKENPFFTMLQPTLKTHCERLKAAALQKHSPANFLLFFRTTNPTDSQAYSYVIADDEKTFTKVLCNKMPVPGQLDKLLDSTKKNVIIMPIVDASYAESLLQHLYNSYSGYQFEVFGMPTWKFIPSLRKADAYPNVGVSFTSPFYYDPTTPAGKALLYSYKREFGGRPAEMTFRGYELLFWYASLLRKYGTVFNPRMSDRNNILFTKFDIKPQWSRQQELLYNENEHIYLYRYQSGSYLVEQE